MQLVINVQGDIKDFNQVDNTYLALKRESVKLLNNWKINIEVSYEETQGTGELPK